MGDWAGGTGSTVKKVAPFDGQSFASFAVASGAHISRVEEQTLRGCLWWLRVRMVLASGCERRSGERCAIGG